MYIHLCAKEIHVANNLYIILPLLFFLYSLRFICVIAARSSRFSVTYYSIVLYRILILVLCYAEFDRYFESLWHFSWFRFQSGIKLNAMSRSILKM